MNAMFSDILSLVNFPWQLLQCFSSYVLNLESIMSSLPVTKKNGSDRLADRSRVLITTGGQASIYSRVENGVLIVEKHFKPDCLECLKREFRFSQLVTSPNVIHFIRHDDTSLYMAHFPDKSLREYFEISRKFLEEQAWKLLIDGSAGLMALTKANISHCDLTPANILVRKDLTGNLSFVVADLGSAIDLREQHPKGCGTHAFVPPESLRPIPSFTAKSDVFSLGMIVVYLLKYHQHPYGLHWNTLPVGVLSSVRSAQYAAAYVNKGELTFTDITPRYPVFCPTLINLLLKMLRHNPDNRISIDRVHRIATNPKHYEEDTEKLEVDLASQKRLSNGKQKVIDELGVNLKTATGDCESLGLRLNVSDAQLVNVKRELTNTKSHLESIVNELLDVKKTLALEQAQLHKATDDVETAIEERDSARLAQSSAENSLSVCQASESALEIMNGELRAESANLSAQLDAARRELTIKSNLLIVQVYQLKMLNLYHVQMF